MSAGFKPNIFALIIGIDAYGPTVESGPLKKAFADSNNIKDWLAKLAVPESQIRVLQNESATRHAIIEALKKLSKDKRIERGQPILIYYAGHGSETDAPKKWNWDTPKIQMILPHDYGRKDSAGLAIQGIPDRTLGFLLSEIAREKGNNITVILDCCHSGSGTRSGAGLKARGVPYEGIIPENLDEDIMTWCARGIGVHDRFLHAGCRSHVLLAACASNQSAYEDRHSGVFTRALLDAFEGVDMTKTTNVELLKRMDLKNQTPQCEGHYRSRFLFDGKVSNSAPVYPAFWESSKFTVEAGAFHGIQKGCKFGIWKSANDLQRQKPHATIVTVDTVQAFRSIAKNADSRILPNRKSPHPPPPSFFAQILDNPQRELRVHVPDVIQKMECFKTLFDETKHRPPLKIDTHANEAQASVGLTYLEDDHAVKIGFKVLTPNEQDQNIRYTIPPEVDHLYHALRHLSHYFYHRDRVGSHNPRIGATKEVQVPLSSQVIIAMFTFKATDEDDNSHKRDKEVILPTDGTTVELTVERDNESSLYGFEITNTTRFPMFPYLFYFNSSDFSVGTLFKPVAETSNLATVPTPLAAGCSLTIGYGSEGSGPVHLAVSKDLDFERGCFRLFIPTRYADLSFMEQGPFTTDIARGTTAATRRVEKFWDCITIPTVLRKEGTAPTIEKEATSPTVMIGIIGSRRNGKATFIQKLFEDLGDPNLEPSSGSQSSLIKEYTIPVSQFECILVDLPAFEDTDIHHQAATWKELGAWLDTQLKGRELASLIWCYNISIGVFSDVDKLNLDLIKDLTGEEMYKKVVVLTTSWNDGEKAGTNKVAHQRSLAAGVSPIQRHEAHEQRLKTQETDFEPLINGTAQFKRFGVFSDPEMAKQRGVSDPLAVIQEAIKRNTEMQREASETKTLSKTNAEKRLHEKLKKEIEKERSVLMRLQDELDELKG